MQKKKKTTPHSFFPLLYNFLCNYSCKPLFLSGGENLILTKLCVPLPLLFLQVAFKFQEILGEFSRTLNPHHYPDVWSLGFWAWAVDCWVVLHSYSQESVDPTILSANPRFCWAVHGRLVPGVCPGVSRCKDSSLFKLPSVFCFPSFAPFLSTYRIMFRYKTGFGSYIILVFPPSQTLSIFWAIPIS